MSVEGVDRFRGEEHVEKCPITLIYRARWIVVNRGACVDARASVRLVSVHDYRRAPRYHVD